MKRRLLQKDMSNKMDNMILSGSKLMCLAGVIILVCLTTVAHSSAATLKQQPAILDGFGALGGLIQGPDGSIYGATPSGGRTSCLGDWSIVPGLYSGCGTIFKIGVNGDARTIYKFHGEQDGVSPEGIAIAPNGNLTGLVWLPDGHGNYGTRVFWLTQAGAITTRTSPQRPENHGDLAWDGERYIGITMDDKHPFYAISPSGDVVFLKFPMDMAAKCSTPNTLGDGDNNITYGPAIGPGGTVYATTVKCVLRLDRQSNEFSIVARTGRFAFVNTPRFDAAGNIYVAAWINGSNEPNGIEKEGIVRIDSSGVEKLLSILPPPDPSADANYITGFTMGRDRILYGVALDGGKFGRGMLFSVSKNGTFSDLHDFCGPGYDIIPREDGCDDDGLASFSNLLTAQDGTIWGVSSRGVFQYIPVNHAFKYTVVFNGK